HQHHAGHEQRGRDRPPNEWLGKAHSFTAPSLGLWRLAFLGVLCRLGSPRTRWLSTLGISHSTGIRQLDLGARVELVLSIDHDSFTRGQSFVNERQTLINLAHRDLAHARGQILVNHVSEGPLRSPLHHRGWHHGPTLAGRDPQAHIYKLAWPKAVVVVGKDRLEPDGAGGNIDLVVYDG